MSMFWTVHGLQSLGEREVGKSAMVVDGELLGNGFNSNCHAHLPLISSSCFLQLWQFPLVLSICSQLEMQYSINLLPKLVLA